MTMELSTCVRRTEGLAFSPLDGEVVILNMPRDNYVGLDEVGRRIWELLATPLAVGELCRLLRQDFDGPPDQIEQDVKQFLEEMVAEGLVTVVSGDPFP